MNKFLPSQSQIRADVEQLLAVLVAIPSVNSANQAPVHPTEGESRMASFLEELLKDLGAEVTRQPVEPDTCNVIGVFNRGKSPRLMFDTHMDTVRPSAEMVAPFEPRIENGMMYGLGACDQKGGMAAALLALRYLTSNHALHSEVTFVATALEESGGRGALQYAPTINEPMRLVVVSEPTELDVFTAHKGVVRWEVAVVGQAGHSSLPHQGRNAIYGATEMIRRIRDELLRNETPHPMLGSPTFNVGVIAGGTQINIIPEQCCFQLERRLLPGENPDQCEHELLAILSAVQHAENLPPFRLRRMMCIGPMETPADHPSVQDFCKLVAKHVPHTSCRGAPFGTDGGAYHQHGHPVVVFGPGSINVAHTALEAVPLDEVVTAVAVYCGFFASVED